MVASIILSDNSKETNNNSISSKVSLSSYCYDSDYEKETVLSISTTKKHVRMESSSSSFDLDLFLLPSTPKTPKKSHSSLIDEDEWSFYNMAPISKKQILYMSDDFLRNAPQLPLLNDDDSLTEAINLNLLAPRFTLFINNDDWMEEAAPRLPYLDDWILKDNDDEKENRSPSLILLPRFDGKKSML